MFRTCRVRTNRSLLRRVRLRWSRIPPTRMPEGQPRWDRRCRTRQARGRRTRIRWYFGRMCWYRTCFRPCRYRPIRGRACRIRLCCGPIRWSRSCLIRTSRDQPTHGRTCRSRSRRGRTCPNPLCRGRIRWARTCRSRPSRTRADPMRWSRSCSGSMYRSRTCSARNHPLQIRENRVHWNSMCQSRSSRARTRADRGRWVRGGRGRVYRSQSCPWVCWGRTGRSRWCWARIDGDWVCWGRARWSQWCWIRIHGDPRRWVQACQGPSGCGRGHRGPTCRSRGRRGRTGRSQGCRGRMRGEWRWWVPRGRRLVRWSRRCVGWLGSVWRWAACRACCGRRRRPVESVVQRGLRWGVGRANCSVRQGYRGGRAVAESVPSAPARVPARSGPLPTRAGQACRTTATRTPALPRLLVRPQDSIPRRAKHPAPHRHSNRSPSAAATR